MVDCRRQRAGDASEVDGCTGDKDFKQVCPTEKLVNKGYATFADLTAREKLNEVKAKLMDLLSDFRDIFALTT